MNITRSQRTASSTPSGKKSAPAKAASSSAGNIAPAKAKSQKKKAVTQPSSEQVALRAYFIGERRRSLGVHGDETSDWVAAERELLAELKAK
jgi:hypothetical protein